MFINRLFNLFGHQVQRSMSHTRFARLLLVSSIALFAVITPQAAFASQTVDPSTLNPPPPPEFNPECKAVGDGTICTVAFTELEEPGGTGIICGSGSNSFEVVGFDTRTVSGRRYYDRNGNLNQRHFREVMVGTFNQPANRSFDRLRPGRYRRPQSCRPWGFGYWYGNHYWIMEGVYASRRHRAD